MKKRTLFTIVSLSLFSFSCSRSIDNSSREKSAGKDYNPKVIAHRGASGYIPEHTLSALAMAHAFDVDYLEADIVSTKDGVLIVMHDPTLNTSTDVAKKFPNRKREDGKYYVIDFTLDEIKSLNVHERSKDDLSGPAFADRFPYEAKVEFKVPTFEEFIITVQGMNKSRNKNIGIYPEVKEPAFHEREGKDIMKAVVDTLTKYGYNDKDGNCVLQIFDYDAVKRARLELGWKGDLAMLVSSSGQQLTEDSDVHKRLLTEDGIEDVSKYANVYAPWLGEVVEPSSNTDGYEIKPILDTARKYNMRTCTWTHRVDSPVRPMETSREVLDMTFKTLKFDELFSDHADVVIDYLQNNNMR